MSRAVYVYSCACLLIVCDASVTECITLMQWCGRASGRAGPRAGGLGVLLKLIV